jgi:hypothetical protein
MMQVALDEDRELKTLAARVVVGQLKRGSRWWEASVGEGEPLAPAVSDRRLCSGGRFEKMLPRRKATSLGFHERESISYHLD